MGQMASNNIGKDCLDGIGRQAHGLDREIAGIFYQ
jgi:hypothetical protein